MVLTVKTENGTKAMAPVPIAVAVVAAFNSVLALVIAFGVNVTAGQQAEIQSTANALIMLLISLSHAYRAYRSDKERWSHMNGGGSGK